MTVQIAGISSMATRSGLAELGRAFERHFGFAQHQEIGLCNSV